MRFLGFVIKLATDAASGPDFHSDRAARKTENLKNWKSDFRRGEIGPPGFQVFRIPGFHLSLLPENLAG
jgi:hypothetical protein